MRLPFAFAKTLNETMKAVEKYTIARTYPRAFDVRNRAFFRAAMFTGSAVKRARVCGNGPSAPCKADQHPIVLEIAVPALAGGKAGGATLRFSCFCGF